MPNLLLVDFNNLLFRAYHGHRSLSFAGTPTGAVYGFFVGLTATARRYNITDVIVCTDTPPYIRNAEFPNYKGDRKTKNCVTDEERAARDEVGLAKVQIRELLDKLSVPVVSVPGLEADDLIAMLAHGYSDVFGEIIVLSNDSDLNQLLVIPNVFFERNRKKYGLEQFESDFPNVLPGDWPLYTALVGSHNGVPGVRGIGKVGATALIKKYKSGEALEFKGSKLNVEETMRLATLPHPRYVGTVPDIPKVRAFSERAFRKHMASLGISLNQDTISIVHEFQHG